MLTTDFQHFTRNPEAYNEIVKSRFINFSDEGSYIQQTFQELGRENVLGHLEENCENGEYIREEFEYAEGYINALTQNIDEILESQNIPEHTRKPLYDGIEIMIDYYDPRKEF